MTTTQLSRPRARAAWPVPAALLAWMVRAYALSLGWAVNLAVAEWVVRRRRREVAA